MRKNLVWHSIASSIVAGIIIYLLLDLVKTELFPHMKATVVFVVGVAFFLLRTLLDATKMHLQRKTP